MKLQHNYTTKEQALRLKAAGLPAETADCMLQSCEVDYGKDVLATIVNESGFEGENWDYFMDEDSYPCWSLGRMIELATKLLEDVNRNQHPIEPLYLKVEHTENIVADMVKWFEGNKNYLNYSWLMPDRKPEPKKEKLVENVAVRYFGSECPLDPKMEVDQYNCVECDCYFATARKSIICRKVKED